MPQRPKPAMRAAIVAAAATELAEVGLARATLATIAAKAGTSVGNLYKYFDGKDELFDAAIPPELVERLRVLLRQRVQSLGAERDVTVLGAAHPYRLASEELLRFSLAHRAQILFLLARAEESRYAGFAESLVHSLTRFAVGYAARAYPALALTAAQLRALTRVYRSFVAATASILAEETSERALREALDLAAVYHLAGLRALFQSGQKEAR